VNALLVASDAGPGPLPVLSRASTFTAAVRLLEGVQNARGKRLPIVRASLTEAKALANQLPSGGQITAMRASLYDAREERLAAGDAAVAIAHLLDMIGVDTDDGTSAYVSTVVDMLVGGDAASRLGLADDLRVSPIALAMAVKTVLRTATKRPAPAVLVQAIREADARLDRLDAELFELDCLRDEVDTIRDRWDPDAPALPLSGDGLDDSLDLDEVA
jgi:hypothetical protein